MSPKYKFIPGLLIVLLMVLQSCTCVSSKDSIRLDGSSTVFVISEAIAEEYKKQTHDHVSIGISGTGGGFKKLCDNRVDIVGASRSITDSERSLCLKNSVEVFELPVAYDGIVVVVNQDNTWLNHITVSQLKHIFQPEAEGKVVKWNQVDPSWPDRKFELFAPGISSGTYDYFTKAVVGKEHSSRGDMTTSEDDNVLVHGVRSTVDSLGFFSFAYYFENKETLKALAVIDDRREKNRRAVLPSHETIQSQEYSPLSRSVFIYANKNIGEKAKVFLQFYLDNSARIAKDTGFIALTDKALKNAIATLAGN